MYTEFIFGCELSKKTPKVCVDALDYVINGEEKKPKYENPQDWEEKEFNENYIERTTPVEEIEKFIEEYDMYRLFCSSSYYFGAANPVKKFMYDHISDSYHISTRADLKNGGCIEKLLEYIKPYVTSGSGYDHHIYAYVQYEEAAFPTIYAIDGVYKDPTYDNATKKIEDENRKLMDTFSKLFMGVCPEYEVNEEEFIKHGLKPPTKETIENDEFKEVTYSTVWDWMVDYLIEKYGNKTEETKEEVDQ